MKALGAFDLDQPKLSDKVLAQAIYLEGILILMMMFVR